MQRIQFTKMHGAGNDFILVDDRDESFPVGDYMRLSQLASRRVGVGCEGIILVQNSDTADFRMRFFNPDGSEVELCGNGARCVAAFARRLGVVKSDRMTFETSAGTISAEINSATMVTVTMPAPEDFSEDFVVAGVPHKIVPVDNLAKTDVVGEGRRIRLSAEFAPHGTNVDFVVYRQPNRVSIRTYERGVEDESGACGTGAVAAAVIGVKDYGLEFPVQVKTAQGYELIVNGEFDGEEFSSVTLAGPVKFVFDGCVDFDSLDTFNE